MMVLDLLRRVKHTVGTTLELVTNYWTKRRLTATSLLVKMIALIVSTTLLPMNGLVVEPVQAADSIEDIDVPTLILATNSIEQMLQIVPRAALTITVTESPAEAKAREERQATLRTLVSTRTVSGTPSAPETDMPLEVKRELAKAAAAAYGIDWKLVEAVWQIESGKRWKTTVTSSAGAQGPMQFMPGTWRAYAVDGNGDGVADVTDARDAVHAGAKYLAANGAAHNVEQALLRYNHAGWYVTKVKNLAATIQ